MEEEKSTRQETCLALRIALGSPCVPSRYERDLGVKGVIAPSIIPYRRGLEGPEVMLSSASSNQHENQIEIEKI